MKTIHAKIQKIAQTTRAPVQKRPPQAPGPPPPPPTPGPAKKPENPFRESPDAIRVPEEDGSGSVRASLMPPLYKLGMQQALRDYGLETAAEITDLGALGYHTNKD